MSRGLPVVIAGWFGTGRLLAAHIGDRAGGRFPIRAAPSFSSVKILGIRNHAAQRCSGAAAEGRIGSIFREYAAIEAVREVAVNGADEQALNVNACRVVHCR